MEKYSNASPESSASMLMEYADFMSKYSEAMDSLDKIDEDELSNEELAYYTEVMGRINAKLIRVTQ
jgi:hypothetical protein